MIIHTELNNLKIHKPILTIGVFDGVHLGHLRVLDRLKEIAKEKGGESVVFTLWPHPRIVLNKDIESLRLLTNIEEKKELLSKTGIDHLIVCPFTKEFSQKEKRKFLDILKKEKVNNKDIKEALKLINQTKAKEKALLLGEKYIIKAKENLKKLPKNEWRDFLFETADFIINREK